METTVKKTTNEFLKNIAEPFEQEDVKFLITVFPKGFDGYPIKTVEWTEDVEIKDDRQYFYTLNPRKEIPVNNKGKITQGSKKTVAFANGLFADIDYGEKGHKKESGYETLEEVLVVFSNDGLLEKRDADPSDDPPEGTAP